MATSSLSRSDALAVVALVFAVTTLLLDIGFFILSERALHGFVDKQNERQDALNKQQIETLRDVSQVMAQVSERARIVQEQVDKQLERLTNFAMNQATAEAQDRGSEISESLKTRIDQIAERVQEMASGQVDNKSIGTMQLQLSELNDRIARIPLQMERAARESVRSAANAAESKSTEGFTITMDDVEQALFSAILNAAGVNRSTNVRLMQAFPLLPKALQSTLASMSQSSVRDILRRLEARGLVVSRSEEAEAGSDLLIQVNPRLLPSRVFGGPTRSAAPTTNTPPDTGSNGGRHSSREG